MNTSAIWTAANLPAAYIAATAITQHDLVVLSGTLNEFTEMIDTIDSYTAHRVLFTTASGVVDSANFTFNSGTGVLAVPVATISTSATVAGSPILTQADEGHGNGIDADTLDGQEGSYYASEADFTAASGVLQAQITSNDGDITTLDNKIDTTSGTLQSDIDANTAAIAALDTTYATDAELATVSGLLDTRLDVLEAVDNVTEVEFTTYSGTLQSQITTNTNAIAALDNTYATDAELTATSGVLSAEIDADISTHESGSSHDSRYYTESELDAGQLDNRYYTESEVDALTWTESDITDLDKYTQAEVDTISGALSAEIDSDISTHEAGSSHDSRYYTESELDAGQLDNRYYTEAEVDALTWTESDITDLDKYTTAQVDTISGSLQTNIDNVIVSGTPATSSGTGTAGSVQWDSDYIYVCVATDTWKRAALSTW